MLGSADAVNCHAVRVRSKKSSRHKALWRFGFRQGTAARSGPCRGSSHVPEWAVGLPNVADLGAHAASAEALETESSRKALRRPCDGSTAACRRMRQEREQSTRRVNQEEVTVIRPICNRCGSKKIIPVIHGIPTPEQHELGAQRLVHIAGDFAGDPPPLWKCTDCGKESRDFGTGEQQKVLYTQELRRLESTLVVKPVSFHKAMGGRDLIRTLLRMAGEAGATRMDLCVFPDGHTVRLSSHDKWKEMPPLSPHSLEGILKYFEWESAEQSKDPEQEAFEIQARVAREDWSYTVVCERSATETVYTINRAGHEVDW